MKATAQKPPRLAGHSANIVGKQMYIFGGRVSSREQSNALYAVDLGALPPPHHNLLALSCVRM
jgi:hypothetical protein